MRYTWSDGARDNASAAKHAKDGMAEKARLEALVIQQRAAIERDVIRPFLRAMAKANNPGSAPTQKRHVRSWHGAGATHNPDYTIFTDGTWRFQYWVGIRDQRPLYSYELIPDEGVRALIRVLAGLMTQHRVPLPPD